MGGRSPTPELLDAIAALLREGGTATSIAARLQRSRGSIVGIVHRHLMHIGFSAGAPSMVRLVKKRRRLERNRAKLKEAAKVKPSDIEVVEDLGVTEPGWHTNHHPISPEVLARLKAPKPIEPDRPAPVPGQILMMDLREHHCRWPLWDDDVTDIERKFFCGRAIVRGRYCGHHAGRMYTAARR